jgi:hypothetical protein
MIMKKKSSVIGVSLILMGLLLSIILSAQAQKATKVKEFRYPLDIDPESGKVKSILLADEASIPPAGKGPISIQGLTIQFLEKDEVTLTMTSPSCLFDKDQKMAASKAPVKIVRSNAEVTGVGFKFETETKKFEIYSDVRVELKNLKGRSELTEPKKKPAVGDVNENE